jgi:hypothetical protein
VAVTLSSAETGCNAGLPFRQAAVIDQHRSQSGNGRYSDHQNEAKYLEARAHILILLDTSCPRKPGCQKSCVTGTSVPAPGILRCAANYDGSIDLAVDSQNLRRIYAKLPQKGGAKLDQIQLSLGHAFLTTTERYLGLLQDFSDAPCDYLTTWA